MSGVGTVHRHVDNGPRQFAGLPSDALPLHQAAVAGGDGSAVHPGGDAVSGDLLHICDPAAAGFSAPRLAEGEGDGVAGPALRQGCVFQQGLLREAPGGVQGGDGEGALCQGAGLVEDHSLRLGQKLQIVAALYQDAAFAGSANAAEKAQGHGDHQGAGAGDDQEDQGPVEPAGPHRPRQEGGLGGGRHHRQGGGGNQKQGQGRQGDAGGVISGEAGDEVLAGGFFLPGVFHQVQNLGHGGLLAGPGDPHPQEARLVYAAADHIVPGFHVPGHGLAGEGGGVQGGGTLQHRAVQGHPLAGLHHDDGSHLHVLRVCLLQGTVLPLQVGGVGADIHQGGDGLAGAAHGIVLEQLTHLVEEHDEDGLGVLAGGEGAHGGQGHEEVLVEDLAVSDVAEGLPQNVPANDPIGDQIEQKPEGGPAVQRAARCRPSGGRGPLAGEIDDPAVRRINLIRQQLHGNQQRSGGEDSKQHFPLLAGEIFHGGTPP